MMGRELTTRERYEINHGRCPLCGGERFQPGPRGGAAQNYECVACGARFNITIVGQQILFAQMIDARGAGGSNWREYYETFRPRRLFEVSS